MRPQNIIRNLQQIIRLRPQNIIRNLQQIIRLIILKVFYFFKNIIYEN